MTDYRNPARAELEQSLGITPIHELLARRQALVDAVAELRALHGAFGLFEAQRKVKLATIRMRYRAMVTKEGGKTTEAALDDHAHADPDYMVCITDAVRERAELQRLEDQIAAVDNLIERDKSLLYRTGQEARLV